MAVAFLDSILWNPKTTGTLLQWMQAPFSEKFCYPLRVRMCGFVEKRCQKPLSIESRDLILKLWEFLGMHILMTPDVTAKTSILPQ